MSAFCVFQTKLAEIFPPAGVYLTTAPKRPADALEVHEVVDAVTKLDQPRREVIVLRVWSGLTLEEIATVVDCSPSTDAKDHITAHVLKALLASYNASLGF